MIISKKHYVEEIVPKLQKELGIKNVMAVPKITKVVINVGVTDPQDPRARKPVIDNVINQLSVISGQKAQVTKAKKSIATFKLREGDPVGAMVTLRGSMMWSFLQRLLVVVLPRVKDFRGVSLTAFDGRGNYSLGLDEQIIFPEINYDTIDRIRPLQVVIVTNAGNNDQALALLKSMGMPFVKEESK